MNLHVTLKFFITVKPHNVFCVTFSYKVDVLKNLFTLNHYFVKYKWHLIGGIIFVTGSNYFGILIPQEVRKALDLVQSQLIEFKKATPDIQDTMYDELGRVLLLFGLTVTAFVILKGILMYAMRQTIIVMSRLIEYDMRKHIYNHLQGLDQNFYRTHQTGDIMARISEDVSKVRNYLGPGILYGINLVTLFAMTIYAMFSVNPYLSWIALSPLPVLSLSIYYVSKLINKKSTRIQQQLSVLNTTAQEVYSGIRIVKAYNKESEFIHQFSKESEEYKNRSLALAQVEAWFHPLMILLIAVSTLLVVLVGGFEVYAGRISAGNIAEFILYVNMLTWPVTAVGWIASVIQEAEASQTRINQLLDKKSPVINNNNERYHLNGDIEFKNVTFVYPNTGITALRNISFKIRQGDKVAIMGKTGAGKTTLTELLTRIYDVTEGEILIDGVNIKNHNLNLLRERTAIVTQDTFLFSDTVQSNIAFGDEDASEDTVKKYADYASVLEDIEKLPQTFRTLVGERGVTLSGGQKQRISIARAFIRNPDIVILDDALSAVDTNTEQNILQYFEQSLKDKTSIIITHRANNLLNYDTIIILEDGKIVQAGTHAELINKEGFYKSVFERQNAHMV